MENRLGHASAKNCRYIIWGLEHRLPGILGPMEFLKIQNEVLLIKVLKFKYAKHENSYRILIKSIVSSADNIQCIFKKNS